MIPVDGISLTGLAPIIGNNPRLSYRALVHKGASKRPGQHIRRPLKERSRSDEDLMKKL